MTTDTRWKLVNGRVDDSEVIEYLPIEALRGDGATCFFRGNSITKTFRSSGTTARDRSQSHFSAAGLALYKQQSLARFAYILNQVQPLQQEGARLGISLIPNHVTWPDSSLAQMLSWIAEIFEVQFIAEGELKNVITENASRPLWIFGTAFHWVNALDSRDIKALAPGSVVFETGGTKGRTREITRDQLYSELSQAFSIRTEAIVSEYGMSELACQAYDFVPHGQIRALEQRKFRFSPEVDLAVLDRPGTARRNGRGAVMVRDPARVDYPWFFRTEDLAELEDGAFKLLGRAPAAPLKGCSLGAEKILPARHSSDVHTVKSIRTKTNPNRLIGANSRDERISALVQLLEEFISNPLTTSALTDELGSSNASQAALQDLKAGLPGDNAGWIAAATGAAGKLEAPPQRWLFILPENHSLVGIYPISLAYLMGLEITIRIPGSFHHPQSPLSLFLAGIAKLPGSKLGLLQSSWRLTEKCDALPFDAILSYGSSETIQKIQGLTKLPVQGFGHRIGASLISAGAPPALIDLVVKDCLGLGQMGCMSSRVVFAAADDNGRFEPEVFLKVFQSSAQKFWSAEIPWRQRVGMDIEGFRQSTIGAKVLEPAGSSCPLICLTQLTRESDLKNFERLLSQSQFCIPIIRYKVKGIESIALQVAKLLDDTGNLGTLTAPSSEVIRIQNHLLQHGIHSPSVRPLGCANSPIWNGLHEGVPLFDPTT